MRPKSYVFFEYWGDDIQRKDATKFVDAMCAKIEKGINEDISGMFTLDKTSFVKIYNFSMGS